MPQYIQRVDGSPIGQFMENGFAQIQPLEPHKDHRDLERCAIFPVPLPQRHDELKGDHTDRHSAKQNDIEQEVQPQHFFVDK